MLGIFYYRGHRSKKEKRIVELSSSMAMLGQETPCPASQLLEKLHVVAVLEQGLNHQACLANCCLRDLPMVTMAKQVIVEKVVNQRYLPTNPCCYHLEPV
jgi:hypothetical protein